MSAAALTQGIAFDRWLAERAKPGDRVQARWTSNGARYQARAAIVRVNASSVRLRLLEGYAAGKTIRVPRFEADKWSESNGAFALDDDTGASGDSLRSRINNALALMARQIASRKEGDQGKDGEQPGSQLARRQRPTMNLKLAARGPPPRCGHPRANRGPLATQKTPRKETSHAPKT